MFGSKSRASAPYVAPIPSFLLSSGPTTLADTHPVIDELADVAKDAMNQLVRSALAGAGRHFTARAEKAEDQRERRDYLDALHSLRLAMNPVLRAFAVELERALSKPMELPADATLRVPAPCATLWQQLREQLDGLSAKFSLTPVAPRFAPQRLQLALRNCVARTDLDARSAELTRELLEFGVMTHLDQVYRRVAERLDQYSLPGAGPQFAIAANQPVPTATPPTALHIDEKTRALLADVSKKPDAEARYSNAHLAAELLENLKTERDAVPVRSRAIIQRLALVGRLFGTIAADDKIPGGFKECFERLRLPMIKSALVDANFLTERSHALRLIAADLARKALATESSMQAQVAAAATDFDLSATFVRPALAGLRPLTPAVIDKFAADLQDDAADRARAADDRVRERDRAESLRQRLAQDLEVVAPPANEEVAIAIDAPVAAGTIEAQASAGSTPATEVSPPTATQLLETLLRSARWYRVFDHRHQKMRWLRLEAFYPEHDSLAFTEFDGTNPLRMQAHDFLADLCAGRSAPCNPDAQVRRLIQQLQKEQQAA